MKRLKNRVCVICVCYDRPLSMKRLLKSLDDADYCGDSVDLIISVDKGPKQDEIVSIGDAFSWDHGDKIVRAFDKQLGLKNHILKCGDVSSDYNAVIVLEDDLTVSNNFYHYVKCCLDRYADDDNIAGISLYKHCFNIDANAFFEPAYNGADVFLMQYAQSWGQCWNSRMWNGFRTWYSKHLEIFDGDADELQRFPENITKWGNKSWLKYYIAYVIDENLYYVYPYVSLTTNHSEAGVHNQISNSDYQVDIAEGVFDYRLRDFSKLIKYDAFFERIGLQIPEFENKRVVIDLYGKKRKFSGADILISTVPRPYKIIKSWKLKMRPQEENLLHPENGTGIFIYDMHTPDSQNQNMEQEYIRTRFDVRAIDGSKLFKLGNSILLNRFKHRIFHNR